VSRRPGERRGGHRTARRPGAFARLGRLTGVLLGLGLAGLLTRAALAGMSGGSGFAVEEVRVEGTRYLDPAELLAVARIEELDARDLESADLERIGERVAAHPLVARVGVRRSLPAAVVIEITERVPVAYLPGEPVCGVDATGWVMTEIDPAAYGSLPFVTGLPEDAAGRGRDLTRALAALARIRELAPGFYDQVSEVCPAEGDEMAFVLVGDAVRVRLSEPRLETTLPSVPALLEEGRRRCTTLGEVDLRYAGTVIYRQRKGSR
jgi:cell division protein FtsQ